MKPKGERPTVRAVHPREALAMDTSYLRAGPEAMFWMFGPATPDTERLGESGDVAVVHVRGPLEQFDDGWGDSYEAIRRRVTEAMDGGEEGPPACVVLDLSTPGGVVAGLNETVYALRKLSKARGIPLHAYVNEYAASAGYALACACSSIVAPPSAIMGSVGVISTQASQAAYDKKQGFQYALITSGARKADGHPHAPITDAAIAAETVRVNKLAKAFFRLVREARGIDAKPLEAAIYLAKDALKAGLCDEVLPWEELLFSLSGNAAPNLPGGNVTRRRANAALDSATVSDPRYPHLTQELRESDMSTHALTAAIKRTEAALTTEKDPEKLAALAADLAAYKKSKHTIEKHESEEGDEEDEEEAKDDDDDAPPKKDDDDDDDDDDDGDDGDDGDDEDDDEEASGEEDEKKCEDEEEKTAKKAASAIASQGLTGKPLRSAIRRALGDAVKRTLSRPSAAAKVYAAACKLTGASGSREVIASLRGTKVGTDGLAARVRDLERREASAERDAFLDSLVRSDRVTKAEAKEWAKKPMAYLKAIADARPKGVFRTRETALTPREGTDGRGAQGAPSETEQEAMLRGAMTGMNEAERKVFLEEQKKATARLNGGGKF